MTRVGVLGTLVWDRIWPAPAPAGPAEPVEGWGGIAYSLAAMAAAAPPGFHIVPLVKLGHDLASDAEAMLRGVLGARPGDGVRVVPEPMDRVELRYHDADNRCERLTGGVPPWRWDELRPLVEELDALFVNFITGFEMELAELERLRAGFDGPIYADLHSLLLARRRGGGRAPCPLPEWRRWVRCCDAVQVNEGELRTLTSDVADPGAAVAAVLRAGPSLLLVTRGPAGAAYSSRAPAWPAGPGTPRPAPVRLVHVPQETGPVAGDPTGCGDVWGATALVGLLAGREVEAAVRGANRAAARKLSHAGVVGLRDHLRAGSPSR